MPINEQDIFEALRGVMDPDLGRDIVSLGFVKDVKVEQGKVSFSIELTTPACPVKDLLQQQAKDIVEALPGVEEAIIEMTARVRERNLEPEDLIPTVKHCIAIASGKGGVGKSTVSVNLAIALSQTGAKVGLLDADVYGPSIPMMMGSAGVRPEAHGHKLVPIERFGIKLMSLGYLLEDGQAVLWRGPMVASTVKQLLQDVDWGDLDYLLVDLPPGTGDAPMSLAQLVPLTGVVLVATPHDVAANIAGKSVQLFSRLQAPILGVVENMSGFKCPSCGTVTRIFAGMSGEELAKQFDVAFLGSIPLDPEISAASDEGVPPIVASPDSVHAEAVRQIAGAVAARASIRSMQQHEQPVATV